MNAPLPTMLNALAYAGRFPSAYEHKIGSPMQQRAIVARWQEIMSDGREHPERRMLAQHLIEQAGFTVIDPHGAFEKRRNPRMDDAEEYAGERAYREQDYHHDS